MPTIIVNTYDGNFPGGGVGHVNVTFRDNLGNETTYGRNIGGGEPDGVRNEPDPATRSDLVQQSEIEVDQETFNTAETYAAYTSLLDNDGYNLIDNNCVGFVDDVLQSAGLPAGSIGQYANPAPLAGIYAAAYSMLNGTPDGAGGALSGSNPSGALGGGGALGAGNGWFFPFGGAGDGPGMYMPPPGGGNPLNPPPRDPLVIDLDNDGIELTSAHSSTVHFDLDQNGYAEQVAWLKSDDGFLAIDQNSNGQVDGIGELFGTPSQDGFAILAALDSNADGKISSADTQFANLRVWRDLNQDGVSQTGELQTLAQAGIQSISLATTPSTLVIEGTTIGLTSTVSMTDGGTRTAASAYLDNDPLLSVWTAPSGFTLSEDSKVLPDLHGFGNLKDLRAAMTLDTDFADQVEDFVLAAGSMTGEQLKAGFTAILEAWAGTENINPTSRGSSVDAKHLALVEHLYDTTFSEFNRQTQQTSSNPSAGSGSDIERVYDYVFKATFSLFMAQVPVSQAHLENASLTTSDLFSSFLFNGTAEAGPILANALSYIAARAELNPTDAVGLIDRELVVLPGYLTNYTDGDPTLALNAIVEAADIITSAPIKAYFTYVGTAVANGGLSLLGGSGADTLIGSSVSDVVRGESGADSLSGGAGGDTLIGVAGNDTVDGGRGDDLYIWARGDGADVVSEGYWDTNDKLLLQGVNSTEVTLTRSGLDVTLTIAPSTPGGSDGGSAKLLDNVDEDVSKGIDQIVFADGAIWTRADLRLKLIAQASTSGADSLSGFNTADTLAAGGGNDTISGGRGNDQYVWARGDGSDVVSEGYWDTADKLVLQGVNPADVTLSRNGGDITLAVAPSTPGGSDGGSVQLLDNLDEDVSKGIDQIVFADGTIWTRADLRALLVTVGGTPGNDSLSGSNVPDILVGNAGNDTLNGGRGDDQYIWARGDGDDLVSEGYSDDADKLILQGVNSTEVTLTRSGLDVTLVVAPSAVGGSDGGSVKLMANLNEDTSKGIDQIVFADGVTWSRADLRLKLLAQASTSGADSLSGFNTADTLAAGAGNDTINGARGDDQYIWARGDGDDLVSEGYSDDADKLILQGVNSTEVTLTRSGLDVTLTIAPSTPGGSDGGSVKLVANLNEDTSKGIDQIVFADGVIWTRADLRLKLLAQASTSGADSLSGFNTADTLAAGGGNDTINGARGDDQYIWARGDGDDVVSEGYSDDADKLILQGVNSTEVTLLRSGLDVTLVVVPSVVGGSDGGSVKLMANLDEDTSKGIDQIVFADGAIWTRADLRLKLIAQVSTSGADTIVGFNTADNLAGGSGADSLSGAQGPDTLAGGSGADTLTGGSGADVFRFQIVSDATVGAPDVITDFTVGSDKISLEAIDADSGASGDQAFAFIGTSDFSNVSGQLRFVVGSGIRTIYGDTNGDGIADFQIQLTGTTALNASDFLL